jgi:segregation and condensation protein B
MQTSSLIESILFHYAEPLRIKRLSELVKKSEEEVVAGLDELEARLENTGVRLLRNGDEITLGTVPEASALIEEITREELSKELSKSAIETLAIVLYKGPLTRAEIDYIRGVNSTFILRNLQIRGLVEKVENPNDQRSFLYRTTLRLLQSLGVTKITNLPRYDEVMTTLGTFAAAKTEEPVQEKETPEAEISPDEEADIAEEDEAGEGFDDEELHEHTEEDAEPEKNTEEPSA